MSLSTGKTGRGVKFEISDGSSPAAFLAIANATSITINGRNAEEIDFTHLMSDGGFREFRQGFKDAGTISVEYHFNPEEQSHADMLALWLSGELIDWRLNFEGAGWDVHLVGKGFVQNPADITVNVGDPISGNATIRCSGSSQFIDVS